MATIPQRRSSLFDAIESILPDLDHLWVAVVSMSGLPDVEKVTWIQVANRSDDARKFYAIDSDLRDVEDFYFLTLDDDLVYARGYVNKHLSWLYAYSDKVITCVHGSWIEEFPVESYYKDKKAIHFAQDLTTPVQCLFPGTGTTAFHSSAIRPRMGDFPLPNIADVQLAIAAQRASIPVVTVPRPDCWVRQHETVNALEDSIWAHRKENDKDETDLINGFSKAVGWEYFQVPGRAEQFSAPHSAPDHSQDTSQGETETDA